MATYDKTAIGKYATPFDQNVANTNAVYNAGINSVNAQNTVQANQYQNARNNATKTLEGANANAYATYQKSIGQNANSSYGSNVSNYLKNASYGTYLNGLGTNQQTYNSAINNANTSWNDWLSSKASQEAELENTRQTTNDSWYQYYMDKVKTDEQLAEQQRQFDVQTAEDQRQFDATMAYNTSKASSGGSSSGSGSGSKNYTLPDGTKVTEEEYATYYANLQNKYSTINATNNKYNYAEKYNNKKTGNSKASYGAGLGIGQTKNTTISVSNR